MTLMDSHLLLGMIEIEVHICAQWFKSVVFEPLKVFSVYHGNVGIFFFFLVFVFLKYSCYLCALSFRWRHSSCLFIKCIISTLFIN